MNKKKITGATLVECLETVCNLYRRKISLSSLLAGLPLSGGQLTPSLFHRAAERAGLEARVSDVAKEKLEEFNCPLILILNKGAVVLLRLNVHKDEAFVWDNGEPKAESFSEMMADYTGYAIPVTQATDTGLDMDRDGERAFVSGFLSRYPWFVSVLKRYWKVYRDVLLASFLINIFALVSPLFVMNVYDRVVPNNATETLWMLSLGVLLAFVFDFVLKLQRAWFIDYAGKNIDMEISSRLLEKVMGLKMIARPQSTGSFVNNLNEFDSLRSFITSACVTTLVDLPFVFLFFALIAWIGGYMALIPLVSMLLCLGIAWLVNRPLQERINKQQQVSASRQALLTEAVQGLEAIKGSGSESSIQYRWERMVSFLADNGLFIRRLQNLSSQGAMFVLQLNTVMLVIAGVYMIGLGELSMGGLIASIMIAGRCAAPVNQLIGLLNQYERAKQALDQGDHIISLPQEREQDKNYLRPDRLDGSWNIQQLRFSYPEQPPLLDGLDFTIKPNEKVAILGRMGSGKTSLIKLLMGFYEPTSGNISLDGIDQRQIDPAVIRKGIGYVPQSVQLLSGTIRENIEMGRHGFSDDDVVRAARLAGLGELISHSPNGLEYQVGEAGRNLSGGQVQAVGLARALLGDPGILIMDEPTSAMDNRTEAQVCENLRQICQNRTLIMVTHRMSMLAMMSRIIVVERGQIVADGSPDILKAGQNEKRKQNLKVQAADV
ncbi:type I secretion system permease/ATPase [Sansalvadorimonas sp. 2012CJ34-2]|uniref:Type I secretion system permease/ATPase n=1 Tax=Parendozoicomonas callyspongiae TaxID=2942213 RepID=A0ABT0PJI9_9GAMM|nr:type I secretion system permease/ATPase [Sansalvadorimonas sp. 2012CJ34-2]MCL6270907.1 type I secretion system permease/ATPase [Sansalvadorimonas sp. 2012CJ34-2]